MVTNEQLIKVLIADDQEFFRDGFKLLLQEQKVKDIQLIAEASNGKELMDGILNYQADVVITVMHMRDFYGIKTIQQIKLNFPATEIIALVVQESEDPVLEIFEAGALGYVLKMNCKDEILTAIRKVAKHEIYFSHSISKKVWNIITDRHDEFGKNKINFSAQEIRVIRLICQQLTTKEIASHLCLCRRTIEDYRHQIQEKIGAKNMVGIALYAVKAKLVELSEMKEVHEAS